MASIEIIGGANNTPNDNEKPKESKTKVSTKVKNFIKKNPFYVLLGIVAVAGLYVWYKSSQISTEAEQSAEGYFIPQTYSIGGGSTGTDIGTYDVGGILSDSVSDYTDNLISSFEKEMSDMSIAYDNSTSALVSQVETLNERFNTTQNIVREQTESINRQNDINKMMQNSDSFAFATSQADKDALHQANQQIADKYGWSFGDDYYWYDENGNRVYQTVLQSQGSQTVETISTKTASSSSTVKNGGSSSGSSGSSSSSVKSSSTSGSSGSSSSSGSSGGTVSVGSKYNGGTVAYIGTSSSGEKVYYDKSGNTLGRV